MGYRGTRFSLVPRFFYTPHPVPLPIGERIDVRGYSLPIGERIEGEGVALL